jgi:hypothetical protein
MRFINDEYLGKGNGLQSCLSLYEKKEIKARKNLQMVQGVLQSFSPEMLESVAGNIKDTGCRYTDLFSNLDKDLMSEVCVVVKSLGWEDQKTLLTKQWRAKQANIALIDDGKSFQPKSKSYPELVDPKIRCS